MSVRVKELLNMERGKIICEHLAGASVIKADTLLGVWKAIVSEVMSSYTNHGEDKISKEEQWAKINIDRNRSSYTEKDCFEKSQNYLLQHS
jgi:hypothetical protein